MWRSLEIAPLQCAVVRRKQRLPRYLDIPFHVISITGTMIGAVANIDYDGDRVLSVELHFSSRKGGTDVKTVRTCERIGQGSFGTVYRAYSEEYPRLALKISTGKTSRLKQELEVLSKVCTKGKLLLPRFEFGALNGAADLIVVGMELCVPCTLHDLLLSTRIVNESDMLFIAHQAAQAVAEVHAEGCIHRDIKLQNFVFDLDGNLKLIDFGLSCSSLSPPPGDVVAGTVSFMAPEMANNALYREKRVSVGAESDIWSLGIVLFSIFTQRNPYPSADPQPPSTSSSISQSQASADGRPEFSSSAAAQLRKQNERLLKRVAEGNWRWPVGCVVSTDFKALVDSILVKNPVQRPTIASILGRKIWNLRRRTPPVAVTAFLGVQDDFLLSRDEAHLMRAVVQRSEGVAASMTQSRLHSTDREDTETDLLATTPIREKGSLKVVHREECDVGGASSLQVYDIRASTRKRSRPIREISQVIAEATAKQSTRSKSRRVEVTAVSHSAAAKLTADDSASAATPHDVDVSSTSIHSGEAATADGDLSTEGGRSSPPVAVVGATPLDARVHHLPEATVTRALSEDLTQSVEPPLSDRPRVVTSRDDSTRLPSSSVLTCIPHNGFLSPSLSLSRHASPPPPPTSNRSCRKPSTRNVTLLKGAFVPSASRPRSRSTAKDIAPRQAVVPKEVATPDPLSPLSRDAQPSFHPAKEVVTAVASKGGSRHQKQARRLELLVFEESNHRNRLAPALAVEHEWLLASFRLTIHEDQERYNITWLGEEQAKSASHAHSFKERSQVTSRKYQYGFVCDMCDYDFLPGGKTKKELHFFHCTCGRDLCPECYGAYRTQCTCTNCGQAFPNSCTFRDHTCKRKKSTAARVSIPTTTTARGKDANAAAVAKRRRGTVPAEEQRELDREEMGPPTRGTSSPKTRPRVSVTAMLQHVEDRLDTPVRIPDGPWRPFAKLRRELGTPPALTPTPEEREMFLHGEWIRYFYLYPDNSHEEPFAFVYHIQPGRTGAVFLTSEFQVHSAVFSMLERQFFVVDSVDTNEGEDITRATTLVKAKAHPTLHSAFQALQEVVSYSTNLMKQRRAPGTVSVYQAPRSAYSCNSGDPFVYVRWFRFNEDHTLSAMLLSNGAVQVFVKNEYELRWFDENRKFLVRSNGMGEMVGENTFALAPAINRLLYETFDT